ncbi:acyl carrier protein [Aliarcobacter skirrowii]|uniref:acyl carrier protein n=1 Tax=Aliarcobacter skirrowii TaxID=28200 RepID=UPI0029AC4A02|nr:acyl carrier protein [Aliarcobacter skirrowii]MDX4071142.1 acyl carrier protein [Aliarcobacter skirrowii]
MNELIKLTFFEVLKQMDLKLLVPELTEETVLLESGLDSLGFAVLVATLEEKLDFDPFSMMDVPFYPKTLGEFISIYEKMNPKK